VIPEAGVRVSETGGPVTSGRTLKPIPQLDGLRAVAVLMVFCNHCLKFPGFWAGVDLFFILSGYLITSILLRDVTRMSFGKLARGFYLRRAERILPPYLLIMLLAVLTLKVHWHSVWWCYAFFLQNIPVGLSWNIPEQLAPLWSLGVEQHFYLFWPALVYFLPRRHLVRLMFALLFLTPVLRGIATPFCIDSAQTYALTPFRLDSLAAGALAALLAHGWDKRKAVHWAKIALVAGVVLTVGFSVFDPRFRRTTDGIEFNILVYSFNILSMGGLFVWTLLSEGPLTRVLSWSPLRWLGRVSYTFYLVNMFILRGLDRYLSRYPQAAAVFVISLAIALVSWFCVEKPILSLSASHRRKSTAVA